MNDLSVKSPSYEKDMAGDEIDLGQLFGAIWRGKLWITLTILVGLCIGIWYAYIVATPKYTATATIALESRQQQVMDIESVVTGLSGDTATINTEVEVMRSRELVRRLVEEFNLVNDPEFNPSLRPEPAFSIGMLVNFVKSLISSNKEEPLPEEITHEQLVNSAVTVMLGKLSVSNIRQSYVFRITVNTEDAQKSTDLVNRLAELYIDDQVRVKFDKTEQAATWLSERVSELQVSLEKAEEELKAYSANTDLVSPEGLVALNRQLKDLRERRDTLRDDAELSIGKLAKMNEAISSGSPQKIAIAAQDSILTNLLEGNSAGNAQSQKAFETRTNVIVRNLDREINRSEEQVVALEASIKEVNNRIVRQSEELVKLQQLQREAEASRLIYEAFLARLKETSVQQGIQQADSRILSQAIVPGRPSAPRKSMILALSILLGGILGAAFVIIRELAQTTFRAAEDLESRTGYSVIGQIPKIPARRRKNVLKYLAEKPNSGAVEAVRNLRTSLLLSNLDKKPKIIMSTSSVPGEGKTTQSLSLAQNFAGLGEKVLLVEGDIRRRVLQEYFEIEGGESFLSVLSGDVALEDAVVPIKELKADILLGETSPVNAADLFSSDKFARFIDELGEKYDRVIIDTPPVLAVPDARVIGQSVDAIIYTVKWDSTTYRQVAEGLRSLESVNLRVSGLVLGQIDRRGMKRYGYGDTYGSYSSYYDN